MRLALLLALASVPVLSLPGVLAASEGEPRSLIVKLRGEGPHAVTQCAEWAWRQAEPLVRHTNDGSNSLDQLQAELKVRGVRAVFRRSDGTPFEQQRSRLAARLQALASSRPQRRGHVPAAPQLEHVYRFELGANVSMSDAVARLQADPHVAYAQINHRVDLDVLLNDPFLQSEGSWGQRYPDQWGVYAIDAPSAWDQTRGEGVVVAVVDTGVDLAHPDIAANLWVNPGEDLNGNGSIDPGERNGIDDDGNGHIDDLQGYDFHDEDAYPLDENGHGTHVAGIIAARGDNRIGIAGVAPSATIMPVRVFPPAGSATTEVVWRGVLYAGLNGADVINASFSCGTVCRSNPIAEEVTSFLSELDVVYVTSAGNAAADVMLKSPERLRESIVVGSVRSAGQLADSSSFGLLVDLVAPGDDVLSLRAEAALDLYSPNRFVGDSLMRLSGTSMAAPHASGVAALLLSFDPTLSREEVRSALRISALARGEPDHDRVFGAGLLSASGALDALPVEDVEAQLLSPLGGDTLALRSGSFAIRASLQGEDLRSASLEIGRGGEPKVWELLADELPLRTGPREISRLSVDDYPDGAYVLRLRAMTRSGDEVLEFAPIALDRSSPLLVSDPNTEASRPAIHRQRLVWEALEPELDPDTEASLGLFQGRFGQEGGQLVVGGQGDQTAVAISRHRMAWLSEAADPEDEGNLVFACTIGRPSGCRPQQITSLPGTHRDLSLSGRWLLFQEVQAGLFACRLSRDGCEPQRIGVSAKGIMDPLLDRRRVVWGVFTFPPPMGQSNVVEIFTCLLNPQDGSCPEQSLDLDSFVVPAPVALSGSLLVFREASSGVFLCELDAESGCDPLRVTDSGASSFDLDAERLVWHDTGAHGQTDIFYCEYDRAMQRCPVQTITHDAAHQRNPRLDGARVVWEDNRDGSQRVASFELPKLRRIRDRVARVGRHLRIPVALANSDLPARIEATLDGRELTALGARLASRSPGRARFEWRPSREHTGAHTLRLRATRPGGLYTEQVVQIEVRPRRGRY